MVDRRGKDLISTWGTVVKTHTHTQNSILKKRKRKGSSKIVLVKAPAPSLRPKCNPQDLYMVKGESQFPYMLSVL